MRKNITHRMDVDRLGGTSMEMGNTLRARQQEAMLKREQGIKLSRAERRAWEKMVRKRKGGAE